MWCKPVLCHYCQNTHAINNFTFLTSWGKRNIQTLHLEFRVWNLLSLSDLLLYQPPSPLVHFQSTDCFAFTLKGLLPVVLPSIQLELLSFFALIYLLWPLWPTWSVQVIQHLKPGWFQIFLLLSFPNRPSMTLTRRRSCCRAPNRTWCPLTTRRWRRSRPTGQCLSPTARSSSSSSTAGTTSWLTTSSTASRPTRQTTAATTNMWCKGGLVLTLVAVIDITACSPAAQRQVSITWRLRAVCVEEWGVWHHGPVMWPATPSLSLSKLHFESALV